MLQLDPELGLGGLGWQGWLVGCPAGDRKRMPPEPKDSDPVERVPRQGFILLSPPIARHTES